jgi:hypothetical protein
MRFMHLISLLAIACAALGMAGCGEEPEYLTAVQIGPSAGTAISGSANSTVQFSATGWYAIVDCGMYGCFPGTPDKHHTLTNATWSTSDPVNTNIDASGLATCVSTTSSPATITATASGGYYGPIKGTATLICN